MARDDRVHRLDGFRSLLIEETRRSRSQRCEGETGQAVLRSRFKQVMQRLPDSRPHVGVVVEWLGKLPLPRGNGKAGVFEFDGARSGGQAFLSQFARERTQKSP